MYVVEFIYRSYSEHYVKERFGVFVSDIIQMFVF